MDRGRLYFLDTGTLATDRTREQWPEVGGRQTGFNGRIKAASMNVLSQSAPRHGQMHASLHLGKAQGIEIELWTGFIDGVATPAEAWDLPVSSDDIWLIETYNTASNIVLRGSVWVE